MDFGPIVAVAGLVVAYGLVSARLSGWSISGPMVFTLAGLAIGPAGFDLVDGRFDEGAVELLAEATLVLLLFSDATRIDLRVLRSQYELPARMLGIGLPLTIALGTVLASLLLDGIGVWEAAIVAAVLSPTDAALGQAVVSDPRVPIRVRQTLNVESGLNDGLMVPVITVLTAIAAVEAGLATPASWVEFAARQIGFGLLVGVAVGAFGGRALVASVQRGWIDGVMRQLLTLSLAVAAFAGAELLEGNGFVAAFVAGMVFGLGAGEQCESAADFAEDEGQLLTLLTFLFFGALLLGPRLDSLTPSVGLFAVSALTVMRLVPVAISLAGTGLAWPTVGYLGWFGPRGLASILFGLGAVEAFDMAGSELVLDVVVWTVALSIAAHGLSAVPAAGRYASWFAQHGRFGSGGEARPSGADRMEDSTGPRIPEAERVEEMRPRHTWRRR